MRQADLRFFKSWFEEYVSSFHDIPAEQAEPLVLKEQHTWRVCHETLELGRHLGLSAEDLLLAEAAALFHDVGRWPQWRSYSTFIDGQSDDHALLGLSVLRENGVLHRLLEVERELIRESVRHHNLADVPEGLSARQLRLSRLLRDADRLDNWRLIVELQQEGSLILEMLAGDVPDGVGYSREMLADLVDGVPPDFGAVRNRNDLRLARLGSMLELNFAASCQQVLERNYVDEIARQLPATDELGQVKEQLISELKNRSCATGMAQARAAAGAWPRLTAHESRGEHDRSSNT